MFLGWFWGGPTKGVFNFDFGCKTVVVLGIFSPSGGLVPQTPASAGLVPSLCAEGGSSSGNGRLVLSMGLLKVAAFSLENGFPRILL